LTEATQQREASDQALQALSISTMLYDDGLDNYLSVAVAQPFGPLDYGASAKE